MRHSLARQDNPYLCSLPLDISLLAAYIVLRHEPVCVESTAIALLTLAIHRVTRTAWRKQHHGHPDL